MNSKYFMIGFFAFALIYVFLSQYAIGVLEDQNQQLSSLVKESISIVDKYVAVHERELLIKDLLCDIRLLEQQKELVHYEGR